MLTNCHVARAPRARAPSPSPEPRLPSAEGRICPTCPEPASVPGVHFPPAPQAPGENAPAWPLHRKPPGTGTYGGEDRT